MLFRSTTLGKAIGGGQALSAVVGRRDVMSNVSPLGKAVHSGTFMAHLLPIMASLAFLEVVTDPDFYPPFLARAERFVAGVRDAIEGAGLVCRVQAYGPRFSLLFGIAGEPRTWRDVAGADRATELRFYRQHYLNL